MNEGPAGTLCGGLPLELSPTLDANGSPSSSELARCMSFDSVCRVSVFPRDWVRFSWNVC